MRTVMKALPFLFIGILLIQILSLPTYRTIKARDPEVWPYKSGIISGHVAIRKHTGDTVKAFLISPNGKRADAFSAKETAFKGPAAYQLKQFDRMMARRRSLLWTVPVNLLFIITGFWVSDGWQRRNPPPPRAIERPVTTPEEDYRNSMNLKLEQARLRKKTKTGESEEGDTDSND